MSLVGDRAIDGGADMIPTMHIGTVMDDTGPTEQMDTVKKQRIKKEPSGKEFGQG